ncbi:MAG: hypothetical protein AB1327_08055 [Bacillota bacterium]
MSYCGDVVGPTVYYQLGLVTSITREGEVKKARPEPGAAEVNLQGVLGCYILPADEFDIAAMLHAYATENPDISGMTDGEALDKLRAFVARFRRDER